MPSGIDFYDDAKTFEAYWAGRRSHESENDTLERPTMLQMLGDISGKRVLDLGCGAGELGHVLLARGARAYHGVDGSQRMVSAAVRPASGDFHVAVADIAHGALPDGDFDLVVSSLVMHYIADLRPLLASVARLARPFYFSAEHPVITSHYPGDTPTQTWVVDHYFARGPRHQEWKSGTVTKYHRTLADYFQMFRETGLHVTDMRESEPSRENFAHQETFELRLRFPLFLFFEVRAAA